MERTTTMLRLTTTDRGNGALEVPGEFAYQGRGFGFGIILVPAGQSARRVSGGDMVPGPWAATYEMGAMLTGDGRPAPVRTPLNAGDRLAFDADPTGVYIVTVNRRTLSLVRTSAD